MLIYDENALPCTTIQKCSQKSSMKIVLVSEQALQGNWHFHRLDEKHFLKPLSWKFLSDQCFPLLSNPLFACY
jgi:hypothetical protein